MVEELKLKKKEVIACLLAVLFIFWILHFNVIIVIPFEVQCFI